MDEIYSLPEGLQGDDFVIGKNRVRGRNYEGIHADGLMPETDGSDSKKIINETGESFELDASSVTLEDNSFCTFVLKGLTQLVVRNCFRCTITVVTEDPKKIAFVLSGDGVADSLNFIHSGTNEIIDWSPRDLVDLEKDGILEDAENGSEHIDDSENDAVDDENDEQSDDHNQKYNLGSPKKPIYVSGKVNGSRVVMGNDMTVTPETLGPEHAVGTELMLPPGMAEQIKDSRYGNINLRGVWVKLYNESGEPFDIGGNHVYKRVK